VILTLHLSGFDNRHRDPIGIADGFPRFDRFLSLRARGRARHAAR
jgi:hypothetical protein